MMSVEYRNFPNNPWSIKAYQGSVVPIPFRIMAGPSTPADLTGYTFSVRGKVSFDQDVPSFALDNSAFALVDAKNGLASFTMPQDILNALTPGDFLTQITLINGDTVTKSQIFTLKVLQSI